MAALLSARGRCRNEVLVRPTLECYELKHSDRRMALRVPTSRGTRQKILEQSSFGLTCTTSVLATGTTRLEPL